MFSHVVLLVLPVCVRDDQDQDLIPARPVKGETTTTGLTVLCDDEAGENEYRITHETCLTLCRAQCLTPASA